MNDVLRIHSTEKKLMSNWVPNNAMHILKGCTVVHLVQNTRTGHL